MDSQPQDSRDAEAPALSHLDAEGRARMVDVGDKPATDRRAAARAVVELGAELRDRLLRGELPKGDALVVAKVAAIQAAKETPRLIPLCHGLALSGIEVRFAPLGADRLEIVVEARCVGATGVEMEAMTGAAVAALTVYDMCKAVRRDVRIGPVELLAKSGGSSGSWRREGHEKP
ncbi:MAG: cyclic pyranopterin monophosphate synthase MoaC [Planctomycetes bacterium]|nr:cyclic pyranopterin monophosphate synthase MoaC [Planctomycetota bacterium]